MRQKVFSIFALLLMAATGAWAQEEYTVRFSANDKSVECTVTLPHTFLCNYDYENGELDEIIKKLYELPNGGRCNYEEPSAKGNESVTAGLVEIDECQNDYITISSPFGGTATVIGTYFCYNNPDNHEFTYTLEISLPYYKVPVSSITLDPATASMTVGGETLTLTPTVLPADAADKTVTWTTSDASVATVADGVVTAVAAGTATITATANDGSGVTGTCTVTVNYPATTLTDGSDLSALSDYAGKTCTVTYTRSFTSGKPSTVCLPFAYTPKAGETFYTFTGITGSGSTYTANMTEVVTPLVANTPYLFMPAGNADFSGTYAIPASITAGTTTSGDWTFKGTYSTIEWSEAPTTPTYGFSAQDANDGITQGQFVKVGSYVRIKPMRAYLEYNGSDSQFSKARALTRAAAADNETLPETIGVRLIGADGQVTAIGTLHTRTGEVTLDGWYTLDGKRLTGQPTQKGIYVNNGKKVIIK